MIYKKTKGRSMVGKITGLFYTCFIGIVIEECYNIKKQSIYFKRRENIHKVGLRKESIVQLYYNTC